MHIEVVGRGPALVLIHGWALHGGVFAPLVERLQDQFELHLIDLPGHGHSCEDPTALRLPQVVNAIAAATPPAVWCGWSLGGLFALHGAAVVPKVRGLVMIAATPRFVRGEDWPHAVEPAVFAQFGQVLALDAMGSEHARQELRTLRAALVERGEPAPRALQEGLALLENTDLRGALPALRKPSLWLAGKRDRLVNARGMQAAAALSPGAQAEVIEHGGHAPFLGHADIVAAQLRQFVVESSRLSVDSTR